MNAKRQHREKGKIAVCDCCGMKWNVSRMRDISKVYVCPRCEQRLDGNTKPSRREASPHDEWQNKRASRRER